MGGSRNAGEARYDERFARAWESGGRARSGVQPLVMGSEGERPEAERHSVFRCSKKAKFGLLS